MLAAVLQNHKPQNWKTVSYVGKRYELIQLTEEDKEYSQIVSDFKYVGLNVKTVERVQNPYLLGAYILRKEQLAARGDSPTEVRLYHGVTLSDLPIALDRNFDVRKYNRNVSNKNPTFYKSISNAIDNETDTEAIIFTKIINTGYVPSTFTSVCDTERLPEIVVKF